MSANAPHTDALRETVLLVDDDEPLRRLHARLLERRGLHVLQAGTAAEALDAASERPVDLLITDIVMPGGSGGELAASLGTRALRVLYVSGYSRETLASHGVSVPSGLLLQKPFNSEALLDAADRLLRDPAPER